jgi:hypothetical protein
MLYFDQKEPVMPQLVDPGACKHAHRQLIAKDEETEYWECLDCGEIFEPNEQPPIPAKLDESLSDA